MRKLLFLMLIPTLMANDCTKEGKNCHRKFSVINKATDSVICATKAYWSSSGLCNISGKVLKYNDSYEFTSHDCWENVLSNGKTQDIYIVDPSKYNNPDVYYNCDSIEIKNKVLKHFVLTLDDLQKNDFTVTYP